MKHEFKLFIGGPDGAGKSTLAKKVVSSLAAISPNIINFGFHVRVEAAEITNLPLSVFFEKPTPASIRAILRSVGEGRRLENPLFWVNKMDSQVGKLKQTNWVLDDGRFEAEGLWAINQGAILVYLDQDYSGQTDSSFSELAALRAISHIIVPAKSQSVEELARDILEQTASAFIDPHYTQSFQQTLVA